MEQKEIDIIRQCQQGDRQAFRTIMKAYYRMVFALALKMLGAEDDAKDVVQDTFLKVWLNIRIFDTDRSLRIWIYAIASRLCLDRLRHTRLQVPMPEDERVLRAFVTYDTAERQLENSEWASIVSTLAQGLSDRQRLVFTLSQLEAPEPRRDREDNRYGCRQNKE